jgi:hypothetical protein
MLFAVFYCCCAGWSHSQAALPRIGTTTLRSWSFVISSPSSSAMLAGRAFAAAIGCSWLR